MSTETASESRPATRHSIVVGVDGSDNANKALEWAALQADRTGAVLEIHSAYEPGYVHVTRDEIQRAMERTVDEARERAAKLVPGVTVTCQTHEDSPARALLQASAGADLLVLGSRGLGGFKGLLLGSVSQKCSLHAQCPTVLIR